MSEETTKEELEEKKETMVVPKACDHKGKLEVVSAEDALVPSAVEREHDIQRCSACGELVFTKKKKE